MPVKNLVPDQIVSGSSNLKPEKLRIMTEKNGPRKKGNGKLIQWAKIPPSPPVATNKNVFFIISLEL